MHKFVCKSAITLWNPWGVWQHNFLINYLQLKCFFNNHQKYQFNFWLIVFPIWFACRWLIRSKKYLPSLVSQNIMVHLKWILLQLTKIYAMHEAEVLIVYSGIYCTTIIMVGNSFMKIMIIINWYNSEHISYGMGPML